MLLQTRPGTKILEFVAEDTLTIRDDEQHIPLTFAMVALICRGKVLLIFNSGRGQWELPGGRLEVDEQPLDCAIRELYEETGQSVNSLDYVARMKFDFAPDNRINFGVLYTSRVDNLETFMPNEEASDIMLWDMQTPYPEPDGEISRFTLATAHRYNLLTLNPG
ncbi:MAG: NUDIX hydrolase [Aggregatilineales bacterium]